MNLYGFVKNARKLLQVACVCLSDHLLGGGGGGMGDFKKYASCKLI